MNRRPTPSTPGRWRAHDGAGSGGASAGRRAGRHGAGGWSGEGRGAGGREGRRLTRARAAAQGMSTTRARRPSRGRESGRCGLTTLWLNGASLPPPLTPAAARRPRGPVGRAVRAADNRIGGRARWPSAGAGERPLRPHDVGLASAFSSPLTSRRPPVGLARAVALRRAVRAAGNRIGDAGAAALARALESGAAASRC